MQNGASTINMLYDNHMFDQDTCRLKYSIDIAV